MLCYQERKKFIINTHPIPVHHSHFSPVTIPPQFWMICCQLYEISSRVGQFTVQCIEEREEEGMEYPDQERDSSQKGFH